MKSDSSQLGQIKIMPTSEVEVDSNHIEILCHLSTFWPYLWAGECRSVSEQQYRITDPSSTAWSILNCEIHG